MNELLDNSANRSNKTAASPWKITLTELIVVLSIIAMLSSLILPAIHNMKTISSHSLCLNHMRNIGIAMLNYASEHNGQIPHVNLINDDGVALHSWRTTLLPYLDRSMLYREIDTSQPWDSAANLKFTKVVLGVFICPDAEEYKDRLAPMTNYFAVVGQQTPFPPIVDSEIHPTGHITLDYVSNHDGQAQTLGFVEASGQNVWWAEPKDIPISDIRFGINHENGRGVSSRHRSGYISRDRINVIFLDGHGASLSEDIDPKVLQALCTIDNYENEVKFDESDY